MPLWDQLAGLTVRVDHYDIERLELPLERWTRVTTTVVMEGDGERGRGEDVTYDAAEHDGFPAELMFAGTWSLDDLTRRLDDFALPDYRRWAFESAALDLALRQADTSLGAALGRAYRPIRFVASTRTDVEPWLANDPALEFKLDATKEWDAALMRRLAALDRVRVVDLKAYYHGTVVDLEPSPAFYRAVAAAFPDVVIEDAWLEDGCLEALHDSEDRLSFDAPVHSLTDFDSLAVEPRWLNIKPSRFGTVRKLLECIEACEERGVQMYGGGQFELGHGREQIQSLASLFYADGPNDVAPSEYNEGGARPGLPTSPLPAPDGIGF
jgi:L-alanine-DL-glutamate epimerase-like enolase superfamily enzyme